MQITQRKSRGDVIELVAERLDQVSLRHRLQRVRDLRNLADRRRMRIRQIDLPLCRRGPLRIVERRSAPIRWIGLRVVPLDPAELRIDTPNRSCRTIEQL